MQMGLLLGLVPLQPPGGDVPPPAPGGAIVLEDGSFLLLEDGLSHLLTES